MKNKYAIILISLILSMGAFGCSKKQTASTNTSTSTRIDTFSVTMGIDTTYIIAPSNKYSPYLRFSLSYNCPVADSALVSTIDKAVFDSLAQGSPKETIIKYCKAVCSDFFNTYSKNWEEDIDSTISVNDTTAFRPYGQEYTTNLDISRVYGDDNLTSYLEHSWGYYYMAAHGWDTKHYITIDLRTNKELEDKDLFIPDYKEVLGQIIVNQLLKKYNVSSFDELVDESMIMVNKDSILPNNNFYISPEGLVYLFNEYEIASYAAGPIDVVIPFSELKSIVPETSPIYYLVNI